MSWITTYTGKVFRFDDPFHNEYDIEDIAHALSNICRFTGHVREFYSVAQHSVLVSYIVPKDLALEGLLHDAQEAYLSDISSPLKSELNQYKELEKWVEMAIYEKYHLPFPLPKEVKEADLVALCTEQRDLMNGCGDTWTMLEGVIPLYNSITPLPPKQAKELFLERYKELAR